MNTNNNGEKRKGYSYFVTDEQVAEFKKLSIEERLRWLEEAQEFLYKTLTPEKWDLMQKLRRGEI